MIVIIREVNVDGCGGSAEVYLCFPEGVTEEEMSDFERLCHICKNSTVPEARDTDAMIQEAMALFQEKYPDRKIVDGDIRIIEF